MKTPNMEIKRDSFIAKKLKETDFENTPEDFCTVYKETVIKQVVARDDEYTREAIKNYAMQRSQEIGEQIRVDFIDKEIVDEIIKLGIRAYLRKQRIAKDNIERLKRSEKRNGTSI